MFGVDDPEEGLRRAAKHAPFVAVTLGAEGVLWLDESGRLERVNAVPIVARETLAAGDVFHGAFALAITEKQELRQALRFASAAAALKCTRFGGAFAAPQRAEVEELLSHGR